MRPPESLGAYNRERISSKPDGLAPSLAAWGTPAAVRGRRLGGFRVVRLPSGSRQHQPLDALTARRDRR